MHSPRFVVKVSKTAAYYFYLNNLALEGKKFWVRRAYNRQFLASTRPLSKEERKCLQVFTRTVLALEARQNPVYLADIFYQRSPWEYLRACTKSSQYRIIYDTFACFQARWNSFWRRQLVGEAEMAKKLLENNLRFRHSYIARQLKRLSVFYGKALSPRSVPVFLIPLPRSITGGGGKIVRSANIISVEASSRRAERLRTIEVLLHEFAHLYFEDDAYRNLIARTVRCFSAPSNRALVQTLGFPSAEVAINEIIGASATISLRSTGRVASVAIAWRNYVVRRVKPLVRRYVSINKQIDEAFILYIEVVLRSEFNKKATTARGRSMLNTRCLT